MLLRHMARPEAFDPGAILQFIETRLKAALELIGANDDFQLAAQTLRAGNCDIHAQSIRAEAAQTIERP